MRNHLQRQNGSSPRARGTPGAELGGAAIHAVDGVASGVIGELGALFGLAKPATLSDNPADCNTWGTNCTAGAMLSRLATSTRSIFDGNTPAANHRFTDRRADTVRYAGLPPSDWSGTGAIGAVAGAVAAFKRDPASQDHVERPRIGA